jgi:hypothetical protein
VTLSSSMGLLRSKTGLSWACPHVCSKHNPPKAMPLSKLRLKPCGGLKMGVDRTVFNKKGQDRSHEREGMPLNL